MFCFILKKMKIYSYGPHTFLLTKVTKQTKEGNSWFFYALENLNKFTLNISHTDFTHLPIFVGRFGFLYQISWFKFKQFFCSGFPAVSLRDVFPVLGYVTDSKLNHFSLYIHFFSHPTTFKHWNSVWVHLSNHQRLQRKYHENIIQAVSQSAVNKFNILVTIVFSENKMLFFSSCSVQINMFLFEHRSISDPRLEKENIWRIGSHWELEPLW